MSEEGIFEIDLKKIPISNVAGLEVALQAIGGGPHTHPESDVVNLVTDLSGKATSTHSHAASEVTGTAVVTNDARLSDARTPVTHAHSVSDITGTAVVTNDARLSDARTPLTHVHAITDTTNLQTTLNDKAASSHTHAASEVTGTAVITNDSRLSDARTPTAHTHTYQPLGLTVLANDTLAQALATNVNTKLTVTANRTLTTTVPAAGIRCSVLILTSGGASFTITFGTGFKPVGTLATGSTTARIFVVNFISDGTNLYETGRTAAMVA